MWPCRTVIVLRSMYFVRTSGVPSRSTHNSALPPPAMSRFHCSKNFGASGRASQSAHIFSVASWPAFVGLIQGLIVFLAQCGDDPELLPKPQVIPHTPNFHAL